MKLLIVLPGVRESIRRCFVDLINPERQKSWFDTNYKHAFWDSLDFYVFDFLMNGAGAHLLDEAEDAISITLYNEEEAKVISEYLNFYNDTFEGELPDSYYINHPKWPEVVEGARKILDMMEANNKKYDFAQNSKDWSEMGEKEREKLYADRCK
jgi:hypothetical protein